MAARHCRITLNTGSASRPATTEATTSTGYGSAQAEVQKASCATPVASSTGRRPYRSTSLPASGDPTAMPTVVAVPTAPASNQPRPRLSLTCSVSVRPTAVDGIRAISPTSSSVRTPGRASRRR
nr:hypothetical protein GCM10020093_111050 [Planobispora longispora]